MHFVFSTEVTPVGIKTTFFYARPPPYSGGTLCHNRQQCRALLAFVLSLINCMSNCQLLNKVIVTSDKLRRIIITALNVRTGILSTLIQIRTHIMEALIDCCVTCMNILSLAVVPSTEFIRNFTGFLGSSRRYQITSTSRISNATPRKLQPFIWTGEYTAPHSTTQHQN